MKVFVVGGTGAVGGHAVPALIDAGHDVAGLARTPATAEVLAGQGARPVRVSMFDRSALAAAFDGHDAVVNLASAIPPVTTFMSARAWRANDRVRIEGSAAVVDAAATAGVDRVVQESVSMLYVDHGDAWIDEDAPTDRYPMARGNHAAEANAHGFTAAGGAGVVLRFGWFYGPGATHSEQFVALARRHVCVEIGRPGSYVSSIHVSDAGRAVVAALHASAGTFNVVDDEPLTTRGFADALADAVGSSCWLRVPGRAAQLLGDRSTSLTRSSRVSNARFRAETGWTPRHTNARDGLLATATELGYRRH